MNDDTDNIITPAKFEPFPLKLVVENSTTCRHYTTVVNGNDRTVKCKACGAVCDPFDTLLQISLLHSNAALSLRIAKQEHDQLVREVDFLKRTKSSIRSALRKLGLPSIPDHELSRVTREAGVPEEEVDAWLKHEAFLAQYQRKRKPLRRVK